MKSEKDLFFEFLKPFAEIQLEAANVTNATRMKKQAAQLLIETGIYKKTDKTLVCEYEDGEVVPINQPSVKLRTMQAYPNQVTAVDAAMQELFERFDREADKRFREPFNSSATMADFERDGMPLIKPFLHAITGRPEPTEMDYNLLLHFMWLVKRNLFKLPVKYHIMLNFTGAQGSGKSTSLRRLVEPLGREFVNSNDLSYVLDPKNAKSIGKTLVFILDEFAGDSEGKKGINSFKRKMTEDVSKTRIYFSQDDMAIDNRTVFIASLNESIADLIQDSTGMRRFAEITCESHPTRDYRERQAQLPANMMSAWASLPIPDEPVFYERIAGQLKDHQETLRTPDSLELWLKETGIRAGLDFKVPFQSLYTEYLVFAKESGYVYPITSVVFHRKLQGSKIGLKRDRVKSGNIYHLSRDSKNSKPFKSMGDGEKEKEA